MDNPYAAPSTDIRQNELAVAGAAPYTAMEMRSAFTRFAVAYWGYAGLLAALTGLMMMVVAKITAEGAAGRDPELQLQNMQGLVMSLGFVALAWFASFVVMVVFASILIYRYWAVMQPYTKRTTPGKAVGFLFIPLFQFYWAFVAYHGLAKDIDAYLDKNRDSTAPRPSTGFVLATMIIGLLTIVPVINNFAMLALLVMLFITKLRLNNSIIGIIQDRSRQQASAVPSK